jgi:hypothetical protein
VWLASAAAAAAVAILASGAPAPLLSSSLSLPAGAAWDGSAWARLVFSSGGAGVPLAAVALPLLFLASLAHAGAEALLQGSLALALALAAAAVLHVQNPASLPEALAAAAAGALLVLALWLVRPSSLPRCACCVHMT